MFEEEEYDMEITLRKANAIQHEIKDALRALQIPTSVQISEFETGEDAIEKVKQKAIEARRTGDALTSTLYDIRRKVGAANTASGINEALADIAEIDDRVAVLRQLSSASAERLSPDILRGRLNKLKAQPQEAARFGYQEDTVTSGIYTEEEIAAFQSEITRMRRQKRELQDNLLALNVQNSITLSEKSVDSLAKAGIV
jgi:uncharacterized protein YdcH (DUF465 family)